MSETSDRCQIYLVVDVAAGAAERLAAAFKTTPIASVLFRPTAGATLNAGALKSLIDAAQKQGVAALVTDDAALARTLRADGVHLGAGTNLLERYETAREILGRGAIVGVDAGGSRHIAMEAGEAGADYVGFGDARVELKPVEDDEPTDETDATTNDLLAWWSEIFEVPCVAFDADDGIRDAGRTGADFVAITLPAGLPVGDVPKRLEAARAALDERS